MYVPCTTYFDFIKVDTEDFMATVDVRRGEDTLTEISLKFYFCSRFSVVYRKIKQVGNSFDSIHSM